MSEHHIGDIRYHTFSIFDNFRVNHAMITRHGGVSPIPWATLNLAMTVGDDKGRVEENLKRVSEAFKINQPSLFEVWQVHGNRVVSTQTPRNLKRPHQKADAIITNQPGLTLLMRFADCVPILLYDPVNRAIGIVHAGWKGTVNQIVVNSITKMNELYGSCPNEMIAGIGPSIAAHHYEVGFEVIHEVRRELGHEASDYLISSNGKTYFDLWRANRKYMEGIGVHQIEVSGICTACNTQDWFSHRGENGRSGRFGVYISL